MELLKSVNLCKVFKKNSRENFYAVKNFDLVLKEGEIVGLLGPNGAGKTTTIKMLSHIVIPDKGDIFIKGKSTLKRPREAMQSLSAVLEGNRNIYWKLTPRENLLYFAGLRNVRKPAGRIRHLLDFFELEDKKNTPCEKLSRGFQQRVAIAAALVSDPPILLLDEPTLGLDVPNTLEIEQYLKDIAQNEGKTILVSSHIMPFVRKICSRLVIMNKGVILKEESVESLLAFFKRTAYRFTLHKPVDIESLEKALDFVIVENRKDEEAVCSLDLVLKEGKDIYRIFDILKNNHAGFVSVQKEEIDLEQAFMRIIGDEK